MIKYFLFLSISVFIFLSSVYCTAEEWYKGGTLHKATVAEWNGASFQNKLATSADWFVSITKSYNKTLQIEMDSLDNSQYLSLLKYSSQRLEQCVSKRAGSDYAKRSGLIVDYAVTCYKILYGL